MASVGRRVNVLASQVRSASDMVVATAARADGCMSCGGIYGNLHIDPVGIIRIAVIEVTMASIATYVDAGTVAPQRLTG